LLEFSRLVARVLPATAGGVRVAGDASMPVKRVALCGGAGDSFISAAAASGADVYVTSDLRHHPVQDALEQAKAASKNFGLIDVSHWAAESLWLETAATQLSSAVTDVKFVVSDLRTDPWEFAVTQ
jgi:putative NIF3 family GTP cyclohydrolase 1 type 2